VRVVIAPDRINQVATGYKASFRNIRFADNQLPGIRGHFVRIGIEVAQDTVHQKQRPADIRFDGALYMQ
jgi:hypothetical protein